MFQCPREPLSDDELEAILAAALRSPGVHLTRSAECWLATVAARHLVERLALAGVQVVWADRQSVSPVCQSPWPVPV